MTTGTTATISRAELWKVYTSTRSDMLSGGENDPVRETKCSWVEPISSMAPKSWASPMLATVTSRRGALPKRRMVDISVPPPTRAPMITAPGSASQ
jgi:hypothetical protein